MPPREKEEKGRREEGKGEVGRRGKGREGKGTEGKGREGEGVKNQQAWTCLGNSEPLRCHCPKLDASWT